MTLVGLGWAGAEPFSAPLSLTLRGGILSSFDPQILTLEACVVLSKRRRKTQELGDPIGRPVLGLPSTCASRESPV